MTLYHRIKLFLNLVWREIEPKSCGIPDPYRWKGRLDIALFDQMGPMKKHIEKCSAVDLGRLLMEMALIRHRDRHSRPDGKTDRLLETAKRYKVDAKKIETQLKALGGREDKLK